MNGTTLMQMDITVARDDAGTPKNLLGSEEGYVSGWQANEVWITRELDRETGGKLIPASYSVRRGWLAGTTAEIDEEREAGLNGLALEGAIECANGIAEERRREVLAADTAIDAEEGE